MNVNMGNVIVGNEILFNRMHESRIDCKRMTDSDEEKQSLRLTFLRYTLLRNCASRKIMNAASENNNEFPASGHEISETRVNLMENTLHEKKMPIILSAVN